MNNNTITTATTKKGSSTRRQDAVCTPPTTSSSREEAAVNSRGEDDHNDDDDSDLLLAIAKAPAKAEGSISASHSATTATTSMSLDGSHPMAQQQQENNKTIHAESQKLTHKNCVSSSPLLANTQGEIDHHCTTIKDAAAASDEVFDILDVVREPQQTTDSTNPSIIRHEKEMEKQKKNVGEGIIPSHGNPILHEGKVHTTTHGANAQTHSEASINHTNDVAGGGADVLEKTIQEKKKINNKQQDKEWAEDNKDAKNVKAAVPTSHPGAVHMPAGRVNRKASKGEGSSRKVGKVGASTPRVGMTQMRGLRNGKAKSTGESPTEIQQESSLQVPMISVAKSKGYMRGLRLTHEEREAKSNVRSGQTERKQDVTNTEIEVNLGVLGDGTKDGRAVEDSGQEGLNQDKPILTSTTDQGVGLAEATPVEEDVVPDMEAQPFDVDEAEKKKLMVERSYRAKLGLMAVLIMAVVATLLGFVLKNKQKKEHHSALAPSVAPSDAPSEIPSSAPTGSLDSMITNLPQDTIEKLGNSSTPQWKAWHWLLNHPNITGLEEWRKTQLFALATFYYSFGGEEWNRVIQERWMDYEKEECRWFSSGLGFFNEDGVYVDQFASFLSDPCNVAGEFVSLHLENLQLSGLAPTIPPEIALLTSLSVLSLGLNDINASYSDMMRPELFQMTTVTRLEFGGNALHGTIPTELGLMNNMRMLSLWGNALTGAIPTVLGLLSNMTELILLDNQLTGPVPTEIGLLTNIVLLGLSSNSLKSQIPTELGLMINMTTLDLHRNQLTGAIPTVLGLLSNMTLLSLSSNALTGHIPSGLALLTKTTQLDMWGNSLESQIPSQLGLMTNLVDLSLELNSFSALIPSEVGLLTNLGRAWFGKNAFTGPVPQELELLALNGSLSLLTLEINDLSGIVPEGLCSLRPYNGAMGFGLSFDCEEKLCGCDWCLCGSGSSSNGSLALGVNGTQ